MEAELNITELISVETGLLTVTVKGAASHPSFPGVVYAGKEASLRVSCDDLCTIKTAGEEELLVRQSLGRAFVDSYRLRPIFFEKQRYEIVIEPAEGHTVEFWHENYHVRKNVTPIGRQRTMLSGIINFGNDIGLSDLVVRVDKKDYLTITIEVFPSKIGYKDDYKAIVADVTQEVYNLAFDALRRTYSTYSTGGRTGNSPIEFFTIIRKIYKDFTVAADMIIARPHHVLQTDHVVLSQHKVRKSDNAALRWLEKHPEHVMRREDRFVVDRALAVQKHVTYDTRENRLTKYMLVQTERRLENFKKQFLQLGAADENIKNEMERMIKGIRRRYSTNFLENISAEPSKSGMSLVFSMAPGYRDLFKYYLMLQRGLSVTGEMFHISTKDMALLYEYWCFIKLNSLLKESGYTLKSQDFVKVSHNEIVVTLMKGRQSRIRYITDKGEEIELSYNPRREYATVPQKPDNVLSLRKHVSKNEYDYEYVFDAKYRIGMDPDYLQRHGGIPGPKEEDINTMHRYRDAIVYNKGKDSTKGRMNPGPFDRTMFGAYVLFPYSNEEEYKNQDFFKSIEAVNIGGFPFLPASTNMVREFLEELITDTPESAFERATLPRGIEEKLVKVDWSKRDVMIVNVSDEAQLQEYRSGCVCRVPYGVVSMEHFPIHYIALYQPGVGIEYVGTVLLAQEGSDGDFIFKMDKWRRLAQAISVGEFGVAGVAYTNMFLLDHSTVYPELHLRSEAEYRLYTELKRRVGDIKYPDDGVSGFEFDGKKIIFSDGLIQVMEGKERKTYVEISEFERRPNAVFRRMMGYVEKAR